MSFIGDIEGIFDPGGDPAAIRRAANAHRELASDLGNVVSGLSLVAEELEDAWKGKASSAFQDSWSKFSSGIQDYAKNLESAAEKLDAIANAIQEAQEEAKKLEIAAAVTAGVALGLTLFSFGLSDAEGAVGGLVMWRRGRIRRAGCRRLAGTAPSLQARRSPRRTTGPAGLRATRPCAIPHHTPLPETTTSGIPLELVRVSLVTTSP